MKRESSYPTNAVAVGLHFALPAFGQQDIKTVRTSRVDGLKIMGQMTGKEQYVNFTVQPISMPASNQRGVVIPNQTTAASVIAGSRMLPGRSVNSTEAEAVAVPVFTGISKRRLDHPDHQPSIQFCFYGTTVTQVYFEQ